MIILKIEETLSRSNAKKNKQSDFTKEKRIHCREGGFALKFPWFSSSNCKKLTKEEKEVDKSSEMKQNNITNSKPIFS